MENLTKSPTESSPRLFAALVAGFNTVASNIWLILLPVLFDLFLWLGPHFRIKLLAQPLISDMTEVAKQISNEQTRQVFEQAPQLWQELVTRFNIASLMRTFPIGMPSFMYGQSPITTPFGDPLFVETGSFGELIFFWLAFSVLGILFGSLYYNNLSRLTCQPKQEFSIQTWGYQVVQSIIMVVTFAVLLFILTIPLSFISSLLMLVSPIVLQIFLLLLTFFALWALIPIFFSAHGIFIYQQNFFRSFLNSFKLVRYFFSGASMFLMIAIILSIGLDVIWRLAPPESWFSLLGIAGHAFISTGLFTASFIYYRAGIVWLRQLQLRQSISTLKA
jgi:hypothetical protein